MTVRRSFPVAEIFGPTIQGEGPLAGRRCFFIRFGGCDFSCIWCDSAHAVLAKNVRQLPRLTAIAILQKLRYVSQLLVGNQRDSWVVLSGGNPCLYDLTELIQYLKGDGWKIQLETQGSKRPTWVAACDKVVISPKPPSANQPDVTDDIFAFTRGIEGRCALKVVVFTEEDLDYARKVHTRYPGLPFYISCGNLAPEENTVDPQAAHLGLGAPDSDDSLRGRYRWLAESVARDVRFNAAIVLPQLHVYAWGNTSGH